MVRTIARVTAELRAINGVGNVGSHVGRAILSDTTTDVNTAEIWVTIDDGADHATAMEKIREVAAGYPGLATTVASYPERQVGHFLPNAAHDVYARVYGQDLTVLNERATAIRDAMGNVPGVENPRIDTAPLQPSINVEVDLAAAERYGVKAGDVRRTATTLLSGIETGLLYEEQKVFEVVVWGKPELRESISNVRNLPIELPSGGLVRLDEVADVSIAPTPTSVRREGVLRYVDVGGTVVGRSPDAVMADVRAAIQSVDFPLEYHAEVFSPAADRAGQDRVLAITAVGAALIAFLLLQAAIGSWLLAALFAATLPLSLAGGVVTGFLGGELVSVGSLAGALVVLAISIRTGIAVIHRDNRLRRAAGGASDPGTIVRGSDDRLQATLASAFATLLAFVPFAILGSAAGLEIARPLALFVAGGLFSSTLVSLFIVPTAYLHAGPSPAADVERAAIEQLALEPATD
jgi:Cu/Ag efflux pump CusA